MRYDLRTELTACGFQNNFYKEVVIICRLASLLDSNSDVDLNI